MPNAERIGGLSMLGALGAAVTRLYDRKGLHRVSPALIGYIDEAVRGYPQRPAEPATRDDGAS